MTDREQRGMIIAAKTRLTKKGSIWLVPSQSGGGKYTVSPHPDTPHCTCPDHETRGCKCKHIYAVEFAIKREEDEDGVVTETQSITLTQTRKTYPQNWPAYNLAQTNEKAKFQVLLRDLCRTIQEPQAVGKGRPRIPVADAIFAATYKVYSTVSGRRFMTDLNDAHAKGFVRRVPCYNSIFNVFDDEDVSPILQSLVVQSAAPLAAIETKFACDSSGFSGSRFDRWYDHKFGEYKILRSWCKAHITCGVNTNIVTAIEIHGQNAADSPLLPTMLATTRERFKVEEFSADLGYSAESNLQAIVDAGASALIPFKSNATYNKGGVWAKLFHYFNFQREEFLSRYHLRSNVESTFSMVKAKFGDSVRSKLEVAMRNEVFAKFICHNLCCLISAIYELGIDPVFPELTVANSCPNNMTLAQQVGLN